MKTRLRIILSGWILHASERGGLPPSLVTHIWKDLHQAPNLCGETCGLVPGDRILHSFRRKPLNKRKQRPRPSADDTIQSIQSFQVITMASALRRYYRRQERLGYDISRFCLITWQGRKGQKKKRNGREKKPRMAWRVNLFLSRIASWVDLFSY